MEHNSNIKKTWEGIREILNVSKKKSTNIKNIVDGESIYTVTKEINNALNKFYVNIGKSVEEKIPNAIKSFTSYLPNVTASPLFLHQCDTDEIASIIANLGTVKSPGPNSIPTNLLKEYFALFISPLKLIINKSLNEGVFPSLLKVALVCPIFKKGDKTKCANYRPISLLSNISKILERIVYNRIENFLNENSLIYDLQYGFRKKHSTNHALISIIEQINAVSLLILRRHLTLSIIKFSYRN